MTPRPGSLPPTPFERIVPQAPAASGTPRSASPGDTAAADRSRPGVSGRTLAVSLGATFVFGLGALSLLPVAEQEPAIAVPSPAAAVPRTAVPAPAPSAAWDDPAALEARAAAQQLRRDFEEALAQLRGHGVERWAPDRLGGTQAQAAAAAAAFADKNFPAARESYSEAAAAAQALLAEVPERLAGALARGNAALDASDKSAAQAAFQQALELDPDNPQAGRGLQRADRLDAVMAKLQTAARLEQAGDADGAEAAYQAALQLDPDTVRAQDALHRLAQARSEMEFRRRLGEALEALDRGDLGAAAARVERARQLRPADPGVQQAMSRLTEARRGTQLLQLEREALAQIAAEDWAGAVKTYRAALGVDATVGFARDGLSRAEPRAQLALQLQDLIDRPARLNSVAVAEEAEATLAQARALTDRGPRLHQQIAALEQALAAAAEPVRLQLRSDSQTEVTLYRVGPLGRFSTRELQLKPGRYVAVGTRPGYRDVRREFEIGAGSAGPAIEVRCEERL